jgi:hypothetical protein
MISGTYNVKFQVDLTGCETKEEAELAIAQWISELLDEDTFPEVEFELVEELDMEYNTDEEELEELDFEEAE